MEEQLVNSVKTEQKNLILALSVDIMTPKLIGVPMSDILTLYKV